MEYEHENNDKNYAIPANYTDSGKLLGGMVAMRNAIEAVVLTLAVGYLEYLILPGQMMTRIIVMIVTLLPLAIMAIIGIDGDSLLQYLMQVVRFLRRRRKLHFLKEGGGAYVQIGKS